MGVEELVEADFEAVRSLTPEQFVREILHELLNARQVSCGFNYRFGRGPGQKVVIVDDLIATGGTTEAIIKLIEELGGEVVKICFVMELAGLKGREHLKGYDVESSIIYEGK